MTRKNTYRAASKQVSFTFSLLFADIESGKFSFLTLNFMKPLAVNFTSCELCYHISVSAMVVGCQGNAVLLVGSYIYSMNSDLYANTE